MSRRKGPRGLRPEEAALWQKIVARTEPLHPKTARSIPKPPAAPASQAPRPVLQPLTPFALGEKAAPRGEAHDLARPMAAVLKDGPVAMDRKAHRRLTWGKLAPEARIDLHGMTLADAHPALLRFVTSAHARGLRLVLVITGKGRGGDGPGPIPTRPGLLRHQVPQWLASGVLRPLVLQVSEAHRSHGGGGAYYVYLRRRK
jgi:DNA-nicking Smr family endonuclease